MTLKGLIAALAGIVLLTLVAPPAGATWVAHRRVARALETTREMADRLHACGDRSLLDAMAGPRDVLAGPGDAPLGRDGRRAAEHASLHAEVCGWPVGPDPWGNRYMISRAWIVSAGANGILETPFPDPVAAAIAGDDVGMAWRSR
jgi:hypothetical protein